MRHRLKAIPYSMPLMFGLCLVFSGGCKLITGYDAVSYKNATDLKVESLELVGLGMDPPSMHAARIDEVRIRLLQAYEYEKGKMLNSDTIGQWEKMVDPAGGLMGGFIVMWKASESEEAEEMTEYFLGEIKKNVELGFDQIISLEDGKLGKKKAE